jgi:hypothetical protein
MGGRASSPAISGGDFQRAGEDAPPTPFLAGNLRVLAWVTVSIDYYGHSALPIEETQRRIAFLRRKNPNWFGGMLDLTDARRLAHGGVEIARGFGIKGECGFGLYLLDKAWLEEHHAAVEFVYQVFGTKDLVISYGMDAIRPPLHDYPPMAID